MYFSKSQRISIRIFLSIILILQLLIFFKEKIFVFEPNPITIEYKGREDKDTISEILEKRITPNIIAKKEVKKSINTADRKDLIKIKGIGEKLGQRILNYREKLGGFVSENQYIEIYGLDKDVIKELKKTFFVDIINIKKLNVKSLTFKELLKHPYLDYDNVKIIFDIRKKENINDIDSLINSLKVEEQKKEFLKKYLIF